MRHSNSTAHGGTLRRRRVGRTYRRLSSRSPLHLVFKSNYRGLRTPKRFRLVQTVLQVYAIRFFVKIEQVSIQGNHIHLMIRSRRRSDFCAFFRVVAGQIPQRLEKMGLYEPRLRRLKRNGKRRVTDTPAVMIKDGFWAHRPFTRIVGSLRDCRNVRDYIRLNELEALGKLPYREARLKGLSDERRLKILWGIG